MAEIEPQGADRIINIMFYVWHTLMIASFIGVAYYLGFEYGKRKIKIKKTLH